MTTTLEPKLWSTMPGWGIVADLTPPELIASRRLRAIRRLLVMAMVGLLLLCVLGYGLAALRNRAASTALSRETARTSALQNEQRQYRNVTQLQGNLTQIESQLAMLLGADVSFPPLLNQIQSNLIPGMTIAQASLTINGPGAGAAAAGNASSLDSSGHPHIGVITLSGTALKINDVAAYIDKLAALNGFADVTAPSTQSSAHGVQYSITAALTDQVLSHKFTAKNGGK